MNNSTDIYVVSFERNIQLLDNSSTQRKFRLWNEKPKYKFIITFLFFFSFLPVFLYAQDQRPTGLILEDEIYRTISKTHRYDGKKYENLPFLKSIKPYCPIPGDQRETSACVAWATGYAALTICYAIRDGIIDRDAIADRTNSASFIFNQIKEDEDCSLGAKFSKAFSLLKRKGDCLKSDFDSNNTDCNSLPDERLFAKARKYKIRDYTRLFDQDDPAERKIEEIRMAISMNNPVIIGMSISNSFYSLNAENALWQPDESEIHIGGHAMVVVGYDHVRKEVEIMNSFGTDWGENGFFKMSYTDFSRLVRYGFQMVIGNKKLLGERTNSWFLDRFNFGKENNANFFHGECYFQALNSDLLFENAEVYLNSDTKMYETRQKWAIGSGFQLQLKNIPKGSFVYVFSFDSNSKLELHYPENEKQSACISDTDQVITIPSGGHVLELTTEGDNFLCVLFSKEKIEDLEKYLIRLKAEEGNIRNRIINIFKLKSEEYSSPEYDQYNMRFKTQKTNVVNSIIPLILKVNYEK